MHMACSQPTADAGVETVYKYEFHGILPVFETIANILVIIIMPWKNAYILYVCNDSKTNFTIWQLLHNEWEDSNMSIAEHVSQITDIVAAKR